MRQEAAKTVTRAAWIRRPAADPAAQKPDELLMIQHVPYGGPGRLDPMIRDSGLRGRLVETHKGEALPADLSNTRGLVVLGGPEVGEDSKWPRELHQEMILIGQALDRRIPVLGISLGAELLAATLGARVYPSAYLEVGWLECSLSEAGHADPLFRGEPERFHAFHWQGDVFELPRGAVALASGELDGTHAFRWGASAYGLRFHLEVTPAQIMTLVRTFLLGDRTLEEEAEAIGTGIGLHGPGLRQLGGRVLGRWVDQVASGTRC